MEERMVKSNQEQAVASWIDYLNSIRLDALVEALANQEENFKNAMETLGLTSEEIHRLIESNRGGDKGMHGFIAEIAECGIGNAREQILGGDKIYKWIDDNGPADLERAGILIQQKFVQSGGKFSLDAVAGHLSKYPDFLEGGSKYQIPKDHYDKIMKLMEMSEHDANRLPSNGELTLRDWKNVHKFFEENPIKKEDLEASKLSYEAVQRNKIDETLNQEKDNIKDVNDKKNQEAFDKGKANFQEGVKATAVATAVEAITTFVLAIRKKQKTGLKLKDFSEEDWLDIAKESGFGVVKGGVRGASIYLITNATTYVNSSRYVTTTPAAVASGIVTASFGIAEQANLFRKGKITDIEFIENSEMAALDASVSALSSLVGQSLIPIPVLGAIIGNSIGTILYQAGKGSFDKKEQDLLNQYVEDMKALKQRLDAEYQVYVDEIRGEMEVYAELLVNAFDVDIEKAFDGSMELCRELGVAEEQILKNLNDVDDFFLN